MTNKEKLMSLQGKVKTLEDLKELAKKENINATDEDLESIYQDLMNLELEQVSGGHNVGPTTKKCWNCHTKVTFPLDSYGICPKCKSKVTYEHCYHGLC